MDRNLFLLAIEKDELNDFAFGNGKYFIADREYGSHWVLGSWLHHIMPAIKNSILDYENNLIEMFNHIVDNQQTSIDKKAEFLVYHLHVFYYLRKEKRIEASNFLKHLNIEFNKVFDNASQFYKDSDNQDKLNLIDTAINRVKKNGGLT